ncbi:membrane-spanning 4-domains subfamily A member 8-like isoform X1 [Pongo pygmaeus]|uniref:Uncharacterized protein n=1 Tax=Pongo abelii TaxID=9601 RepID=A0A8I5UUL4_PONAB|nr:membrane-spanning 4-domains subfamily A member 8-like isoform X1 [Pongo pygmaeus]XP_054296344.1 membrane-spanning 4-domains subfamily A member 8-like isoform X1 [Pongo pygmaeus]XP_054296345.1 membrane-spanning 4-domains subfamily A member 8-like isoform X1 [Pongo pygmaeus]XP_054296346.1 membrane-spanning 4-domains subfamily A member 8-like isoform X1 [Pongo pygmaeus]XP_054296347.1 membrane-spanning 4-domains subfamily A member 8-like isoform X1 [Pongo pygmaeus]XP_054296348.1 membrane-spanni
MPRRFILKEGTKAMGAVQIMIGLIHSALGTLWIHWILLREDSSGSGPIPIIAVVIYSFLSSFFFINSGSSSVIQKPVTRYKLTLAIVMNSITICVTTLGIILLSTEIATFALNATTYNWSNMVGMLLLQYLLFCTILEMTIVIIIIQWVTRAFHHEKHTEESTSPSEISLSESLEITPRTTSISS